MECQVLGTAREVWVGGWVGEGRGLSEGRGCRERETRRHGHGKRGEWEDKLRW